MREILFRQQYLAFPPRFTLLSCLNQFSFCSPPLSPSVVCGAGLAPSGVDEVRELHYGFWVALILLFWDGHRCSCNHCAAGLTQPSPEGPKYRHTRICKVHAWTNTCAHINKWPHMHWNTNSLYCVQQAYLSSPLCSNYAVARTHPHNHAHTNLKDNLFRFQHNIQISHLLHDILCMLSLCAIVTEFCCCLLGKS